jgi:hypothetical protein
MLATVKSAIGIPVADASASRNVSVVVSGLNDVPLSGRWYWRYKGVNADPR